MNTLKLIFFPKHWEGRKWDIFLIAVLLFHKYFVHSLPFGGFLKILKQQKNPLIPQAINVEIVQKM